MDQGFQYVLNNSGIDAEADYPYLGIDSTCAANRSARAVATIDSFHDVQAGSEAQLAAAVQLGPVAVAIEADQSGFQSYKSGVFDAPCGTNLDHGVLVVGLTDDAYIVKNSWGASWGMSGYIEMKRNVNKTRICGIAMQASYPVKASPRRRCRRRARRRPRPPSSAAALQTACRRRQRSAWNAAAALTVIATSVRRSQAAARRAKCAIALCAVEQRARNI